MVAAGRLREVLRRFDGSGELDEEGYGVIRETVADVGRVPPELLDGFVGLFFERHLLDDRRRGELVAMASDELVRAVRHRFKQVVAGAHDSHAAYHALSAHVRAALRVVRGPAAGWPSRLMGPTGYSSIAVEQAVAALWAELHRAPAPREAVLELFARYGDASGPAAREVTREVPAVLAARLDAQRLARGVLELLSEAEKDLLRSQIDGERVEPWAQRHGVSRATAYRMLARLKALCQAEFFERSDATRLEVLDALRAQL